MRSLKKRQRNSVGKRGKRPPRIVVTALPSRRNEIVFMIGWDRSLAPQTSLRDGFLFFGFWGLKGPGYLQASLRDGRGRPLTKAVLLCLRARRVMVFNRKCASVDRVPASGGVCMVSYGIFRKLSYVSCRI